MAIITVVILFFPWTSSKFKNSFSAPTVDWYFNKTSSIGICRYFSINFPYINSVILRNKMLNFERSFLTLAHSSLLCLNCLFKMFVFSFKFTTKSNFWRLTHYWQSVYQTNKKFYIYYTSRFIVSTNIRGLLDFENILKLSYHKKVCEPLTEGMVTYKSNSYWLWETIKYNTAMYSSIWCVQQPPLGL